MRGRKLRWVLALAVLVMAVLVAALPVVLAQPKQPSTITLESWDEILERNYAKGITRSEVEAILGPAGDYRTRHGQSFSRWHRPSHGQLAFAQHVLGVRYAHHCNSIRRHGACNQHEHG
jgi:hypothetical protein